MNRVASLVHVFLEKAVNVVSDIPGVVRNRKLPGSAKLALLVVRIVLESVVEFAQKKLVVSVFH